MTHSWADLFYMGLGTCLFGTVDRRWGPAAALLGFRSPEGLSEADRAAYAKVRQVRWRPGMVRDGHFGDHMGWSTVRFARRFLAPIVPGESDPGQRLVWRLGEKFRDSWELFRAPGVSGDR